MNFLVSKVCEEWKYIALVIDRLFLLIFTTACLVGTVSIILQAPSFYGNTNNANYFLTILN